MQLKNPEYVKRISLEDIKKQQERDLCHAIHPGFGQNNPVAVMTMSTFQRSHNAVYMTLARFFYKRISNLMTMFQAINIPLFQIKTSLEV